MNIIRLIFAARRKWWLIILMPMIGAGLAFLSVYLFPPNYKADTILYTINTVDKETGQTIVQKYSDILKSRKLISEVLNAVNHSITESELSSMVSITSKDNSNIITISVIWSNPTIAAEVANAVGNSFSLQMKNILNREVFRVLDVAIVPDRPVPNNLWKKVFLGIMAGCIISFGTVYVTEYYSTKIHTAEDIEENLNIRVIGMIPEHSIDKGGIGLGFKNL